MTQEEWYLRCKQVARTIVISDRELLRLHEECGMASSLEEKIDAILKVQMELLTALMNKE